MWQFQNGRCIAKNAEGVSNVNSDFEMHLKRKAQYSVTYHIVYYCYYNKLVSEAYTWAIYDCILFHPPSISRIWIKLATMRPISPRNYFIFSVNEKSPGTNLSLNLLSAIKSNNLLFLLYTPFRTLQKNHLAVPKSHYLSKYTVLSMFLIWRCPKVK